VYNFFLPNFTQIINDFPKKNEKGYKIRKNTKKKNKNMLIMSWKK
jgi:hypothetical protein